MTTPQDEAAEGARLLRLCEEVERHDGSTPWAHGAVLYLARALKARLQAQPPAAVTKENIRAAMCNADATIKCEWPHCTCHGEFKRRLDRYTKAVMALLTTSSSPPAGQQMPTRGDTYSVCAACDRPPPQPGEMRFCAIKSPYRECPFQENKRNR